MVHLILAAAVMTFASGDRLAAQEGVTVTPTVFRRFGDRVVRIQVVEAASAAKVSVGSGFFIDDEGRLVTNYHVIAELVHDAARYRAELGEGTTPGDTVTILAIDVVHDLAILQAARRPRPHFTLGPTPVHQGDRLYSLGHPHDLGLSIVEGTYNGLLSHTLYPKLHFTGSLNPGMSGGPTITSAGHVVGINVSTAGNQVSFLVPVDRAIALAATTAGPEYQMPSRLLEDVGSQIHAYQDVYLEDLFRDTTKMVDLGPFRVPTEPAAFFRCWGDVPDGRDLPYERAQHRCSTDDEVYIAHDQQSGVVDLTHELITTTSLNASRFYRLYGSIFQIDNTPPGREEHVTTWRCSTRNILNAITPLRTVLCLRAYVKLEGLYDGVVKVAVLGRRDAGLVSTLELSGVSFENIERLAARFLEQFAWR
ncbi:MAG TPA: serine protease [Gemmatimonadales bacterium]